MVEDRGVAAEGDEVSDDLCAEGLEDEGFFGADAQFSLVDSGAEGGPFGEVEGPGGFGGADVAGGGEGVEGGAHVFGAFDVADVAEAGGPAEGEALRAELLAQLCCEGGFFVTESC